MKPPDWLLIARKQIRAAKVREVRIVAFHPADDDERLWSNEKGVRTFSLLLLLEGAAAGFFVGVSKGFPIHGAIIGAGLGILIGTLFLASSQDS